MYCVKCGVKLSDDLTVCPLCQTKVYYNEEQIKANKEKKYPENMPIKNNANKSLASILTMLSMLAITIVLILCYQLYDEIRWGGYAIFSIAVFYCVLVLPLWFKKFNPIVSAVINHTVISLFLLYINLKTDGNWFLSFALPLNIIICINVVLSIILIKYVSKGGYFIAGGIIILIGLSSMLIEFFQHLTFNTRMFIWSGYVISCCAIFGLFLILAGIIKPLKNYLDQKFFI
ncbi:MAG TPA: DUF6320 domain-containing protein [Erysipelotrichaceae bacterium]|nr:DUF6320 domain-containing protein [Erysipelotrichaceae bacterium]HQB31869.1 DUF6320 domain-containing protein [Erysipelotrichaceae bacterium]